MTLPVRFTAAAETDFRQARAWYAHIHAELGPIFTDNVNLALKLIQENPSAYATIHREIRRICLRKFPYGLYYIQHGGMIIVLAIMHFKQDPAIWLRRM